MEHAGIPKKFSKTKTHEIAFFEGEASKPRMKKIRTRKALAAATAPPSVKGLVTMPTFGWWVIESFLHVKDFLAVVHSCKSLRRQFDRPEQIRYVLHTHLTPLSRSLQWLNRKDAHALPICDICKARCESTKYLLRHYVRYNTCCRNPLRVHLGVKTMHEPLPMDKVVAVVRDCKHLLRDIQLHSASTKSPVTTMSEAAYLIDRTYQRASEIFRDNDIQRGRLHLPPRLLARTVNRMELTAGRNVPKYLSSEFMDALCQALPSLSLLDTLDLTGVGIQRYVPMHAPTADANLRTDRADRSDMPATDDPSTADGTGEVIEFHRPMFLYGRLLSSLPKSRLEVLRLGPFQHDFMPDSLSGLLVNVLRTSPNLMTLELPRTSNATIHCLLECLSDSKHSRLERLLWEPFVFQEPADRLCKDMAGENMQQTVEFDMSLLTWLWSTNAVITHLTCPRALNERQLMLLSSAIQSKHEDCSMDWESFQKSFHLHNLLPPGTNHSSRLFAAYARVEHVLANVCEVIFVPRARWEG